MDNTHGVTLIELLITLVILFILASVALPLTKVSATRAKELELRQALRTMRTAIDHFRNDWARDQNILLGPLCVKNQISCKEFTGITGYPKTLETLLAVELSGAEATVEESNPVRRYLRRIPLDPVTNSIDWGLRCYQDGMAVPRAVTREWRSADVGKSQPLTPWEVLMRQCIRLAIAGSIAIVCGLAFAAASHAQSTQWTTFRYDTLGRVTRTTYPDGSQTRACYDDGVTVEIDANQHKTRTTRDAYGRVVKVEEYTGTSTTCSTARGTPYATTTYTYDRLGNLLTVTDALGNRTTMQYDTLSRKTQMRDPDLGTWTYQYDLNGNLTRQTDAKNQQIHFRYDSLNRRVQKDYGTQKALGSGDVRYTYDGSSYRRQGRLAQVVDGSGTTAFRYDAVGRVTRTDKIVDSVTYTTQTAYDGLGRVTSLTYPDNSVVTYTYTGPQLQSVQAGTTTYARYSGFNSLGQPSTLTFGNGATTTYTYDARNFRLKTLATAHGTTTLQDLSYTYDSGGNVTGITDPRHGNQTLTYDALDRLTTATNAATGGYGTITYTYNQIGNMLSHSQVGTYTYPASGTSSRRPHAVTRAGTNTYSYDANGNLRSGGGQTLTWDYENRPTRIVKGGETTTFVYDGDGGRVKKTVAGRTTVYIGQSYVCTGTACAKLIYAGGQRIAMVQATSGSTSYFHGDHLGSTNVLTASNGTAEEHNSYRPYGEIHTHTGTSDVVYKYTGQERDASTDLYFYQARYYAQGVGRFVSPDPLVPDALDPQAFNRYAYGRNNPVRYTDPTGYSFHEDFFDWWPCCDWNPDLPWDPPVDPIDNPVTGVPIFPQAVVHGTQLPSWFPDPFGTNPWELGSWLNDSLLAILSEVDELQLVVGIGGTIGGNPSLERDLPGLFLHAEVNVGFAVNVGSLLDSRFFVSAQISPMIGLGYYGGLGWQAGAGGFTRLTPGGYSQSVSAHAEGGHGRGPSLSGGIDFPVRRPDPYSASLTVNGAALIKGRGGVGYGTYGAVGPGFNFILGSPTFAEMFPFLP